MGFLGKGLLLVLFIFLAVFFTSAASVYLNDQPVVNINESDPIWRVSPSYGITSLFISDWNNAYAWGNHSQEGYLTYESDPHFILWNYNWNNLTNIPGYVVNYSSDIGARAYPGACPYGQFVVNTTTGGVDCAYPTSTDLSNYWGERVPGYLSQVSRISFNKTAGYSGVEGELYWDTADKTLALKGEDWTLQIGQELYSLVYNDKGYTLPNGYGVFQDGQNGGLPTVELADSSNIGTGIVIGITTQSIAPGQTGMVTILGIVHDVNTSAWSPGTTLYIDEAGNGDLTDVKPTCTSCYPMTVGQVVEQGEQGSLFVRPRTAEIDPIFANSVAYDIVYNDTLNWNEAFSWGNHALAGYLSGSGTNMTIPMWNGNKTLGDSPITRVITDEDNIIFYDGDLYIDDTNGMVGVNIGVGEEQSHQSAFVVQSEIHQGFGAITSRGDYDELSDSTGVDCSEILPESFVDAGNFYVNGSTYYIYIKENDTSFRVRGNWSNIFTSNNWTWRQAPYIDVNGPSDSERGYTISSNGDWQWAMLVPDDSNDGRFCVQNRNAWFNGNNNAYCIASDGTMTVYGTLVASGLDIGNSTIIVGGLTAPTVNATTIFINNSDLQSILDGKLTANDLINYYIKSENYNKTEVDQLISNISLTPGPQGIQGMQGIQGIPGVNGTNGVNGTSYYVGGVYLYNNGSNIIFFNDSALPAETDPIWNADKSNYYNQTYIDGALATLENLYAGFKTLPTWTDNGDGTITFGAGTVGLYDNANNEGYPITFNLLGGTTGSAGVNAIPDNAVSYLVAEYNAGSPKIQVITNRDLIHVSDYVPFLTITRMGTKLYVLAWGAQANGMSEKLTDRLVRTERFSRETGLVLSENGDLTLTVTSGVLWYGATRLRLDAADSSVTGLDVYYETGPNTFAEIEIANGKYNNTVYNNGTSVVELANGTFANIWIYRNIKTPAELDAMMGSGEYASSAEALVEGPHDTLPLGLQNNYVLVGRITFEKGASTGIVTSSWESRFESSSVTNHNDLGGIQGGANGEFYHLTSSEYVDAQSLAGMLSADPVYGVMSLNRIADINQAGTLSITTKDYAKVGTLSFVSYNPTTDESIIKVNGGDTAAVYDAYSVNDANGTEYYVNSVINSTHMTFEGNASTINGASWTYQQPPYIDFDATDTFEEKGISWSTAGDWKWALYEPHNTNERICFASSVAPLSEVWCVYENADVIMTGNLTANYINAPIDASNILNAPWALNGSTGGDAGSWVNDSTQTRTVLSANVSGNIYVGNANTGSIIANKELIMGQVGDVYGPSYLILRNRNTENGAIYFNPDPTNQLVDFIFRTNSTQRNIRFENRTAFVLTTNPEFHIGGASPDAPSLVVGDSYSAFSGNLVIGSYNSSTGLTIRNVSGNVDLYYPVRNLTFTDGSDAVLTLTQDDNAIFSKNVTAGLFRGRVENYLNTTEIAALGHLNATGVVAAVGNFSAANSTLARTGNCPSGQFVTNTTTGGVVCAAATVTNVFGELTYPYSATGFTITMTTQNVYYNLTNAGIVLNNGNGCSVTSNLYINCSTSGTYLIQATLVNSINNNDNLQYAIFNNNVEELDSTSVNRISSGIPQTVSTRTTLTYVAGQPIQLMVRDNTRSGAVITVYRYNIIVQKIN